MTAKLLPFLTVALLAAPWVRAQDGRPVAFVNARLLTMAGEVIEQGTLLVRDGRIAGVGADVEVPAGTRVIDVAGGTIMPGLIDAWSRAGATDGGQSRSRGPSRRGRRGRRSRGRSRSKPANNAAAKVADGLYARQDIYGELLEGGVTTLAMVPRGSGFPGTAALLDPSGTDRESMTRDDAAFLVIGPGRDDATRKVLREGIAKAQKVLEARKKAAEEKKKAAQAKEEEAGAGKKDEEKGGGKKPAPKGGEAKKPDEQEAKKKKKPSKPKDPNAEVLAELITGNHRALVELNSATDVLYWVRTVDPEKVKLTEAVVATRLDDASGRLDQALEALKSMEPVAVLIPPSLSEVPRTSYLINPAARLHTGGVTVGFLIPDDTRSLRTLFFDLMELVRHGLPREAALRGVTAVPARALGIAGDTGTLEEGKRADLLWFSGDPLDPTSRLLSVWHAGRRAGDDDEEMQR